LEIGRGGALQHQPFGAFGPRGGADRGEGFPVRREDRGRGGEAKAGRQGLDDRLKPRAAVGKGLVADVLAGVLKQIVGKNPGRGFGQK
jgi:hypothetical protein